MRRAGLSALGVYAALVALHAPLLRLPYFWDEAGYFIFAALDCFRHGWLIPHSTLPNGHPPLLSLYLAGAWLLAGFHPLVTRMAMLVWATALLLGVWRLARPRLGQRAWVAPLLLGLMPLVFAQSTLAQLDLPAAALIVWALVYFDANRLWPAAALFTAACLTKETAIIAPLALLATMPHRCRLWPLLIPLAAVALWFAFYHHTTGYWFGNPEFFAYNVRDAALSLPRIGLSLLRRIWQLGFYDSTGLLTALAVVGAWGKWPRMPRSWLTVIAAYLGFHSVIGGAVLARYLLPALALYYVWLAEALLQLRWRTGVIALAAAALVAGWFWNPPYPFPFEDNLAYAQFVRLHQAAARELEANPPAGPVWTAWPATDELSRPELGYVTRPLAVHALEDFSPESLAQVSGDPAALYLYSRVYQPQTDLAADLPFYTRWSQRFFDYAPPAPASAWMARTGLQPRWRQAGGGQWVLVASAGRR